MGGQFTELNADKDLAPNLLYLSQSYYDDLYL